MNVCFSFEFVLFLFVAVITAEERQLDCIDAKRKLRCVVSANCPENRQIINKGCPTGRTCCMVTFRTNLYLPLRKVPKFLNDEPPLLNPYGRALPEQDNKLILDTMEDLESQNSISKPERLPIFEHVFESIDKDNSTSVDLNNYSMVFPHNDELYDAHDIKKFLTNLNKKNLQKKILKTEENETKLLTKTMDMKPGEKSEKYCREYTRLTSNKTYGIPELVDKVGSSVEVDSNCPPRYQPLIVGGTKVYDYEFPHMAALGFAREDIIDYLCGASLISENFLVTAAHCSHTRWGAPVKAQLGSIKLHSPDAVVADVAEVIQHPDFAEPATYNDIALVRLKEKLVLSMHVRPACLPSMDTKAQYAGNTAIATGWGKTGFARESSTSLLKVKLKVFETKKCDEIYSADRNTPRLSQGILPSMLCAGGIEDVYDDTCQGDSGGPLQALLPGNDCMIQLIGVTSFGKSCGAGYPGVYTRIAAFVPWIESVIWP